MKKPIGNLRLTCAMCCVFVDNPNSDTPRMVDLGNYYKDEKGEMFAVLKLEDARKYSHLISETILILRSKYDSR